jgi:hypothetical protein
MWAGCWMRRSQSLEGEALMVRVIDPMRRTLPVTGWPPVDQKAWAATQTAGDNLDEGGRAAQWAAETKRTNAQHYGRWLGYLAWRGILTKQAHPADRVTRNAVRVYNRHLGRLVAPRLRTTSCTSRP